MTTSVEILENGLSKLVKNWLYKLAARPKVIKEYEKTWHGVAKDYVQQNIEIKIYG